MTNKKYSLPSIMAILFFVLFCGSAFINFKLVSYLNEYDEQLEKQDSMIRRLTFSSDLVKEYFDIEEDTVAHTTTYSLKESKRTKETEHITKYVEHTFVRDGKEMTTSELVASINATDQESVEAVRSLVSKYNTLVHDYNQLREKYITTKDSLVIQEIALGLIKRNYAIDYNTNLKGETRTIQVMGEKVDSALLLLPYYRHKLNYDPKSKAWIVEYEKLIKK